MQRSSAAAGFGSVSEVQIRAPQPLNQWLAALRALLTLVGPEVITAYHSQAHLLFLRVAKWLQRSCFISCGWGQERSERDH